MAIAGNRIVNRKVRKKHPIKSTKVKIPMNASGIPSAPSHDCNAAGISDSVVITSDQPKKRKKRGSCGASAICPVA